MSRRSLDRNESGESNSLRLLYRSRRGASSAPNLTGVAQRKRAGLITPRSYDRNVSPVSFHFGSFTEAAGALDAPIQGHYSSVWCKWQHVVHLGFQIARSMLATGIFHFTCFTEAARGTYVPLRPLCAEGFKGNLGFPVLSRRSSAEERLNPRPSPLSTSATAMV